MDYSWKKQPQSHAPSAQKTGKREEGLSRGVLIGVAVSLGLELALYIIAFALVASAALALFLLFM
jgi:hypothetical protein